MFDTESMVRRPCEPDSSDCISNVSVGKNPPGNTGMNIQQSNGGEMQRMKDTLVRLCSEAKNMACVRRVGRAPCAASYT